MLEYSILVYCVRKKYAVFLLFFLVITSGQCYLSHCVVTGESSQIAILNTHVYCHWKWVIWKSWPQSQWDITAYVFLISWSQLRPSITCEVLPSSFNFPLFCFISCFVKQFLSSSYGGIMSICSPLSRKWLILARKPGTHLEPPGIFLDCSTLSWTSFPSQQYFSTLFRANIIHDKEVRMLTKQTFRIKKHQVLETNYA